MSPRPYRSACMGTAASAVQAVLSMAVSAVDCYCTISVTTSPCAAPPTAAAVTVICDVPTAVGASTFTVADPGAVASADVAVTVTVAGFGTNAGVVYSPVPSTVPFVVPPATAQVTLWLVELVTVAENCF